MSEPNPQCGGVVRPHASLCIVLPLLNEAANVGPLLERIDASLLSCRYVVCVIDDGSVDSTVKLAIDTARRIGSALHVIQRVKEHSGSQRGSALYVGMKWGLDNTPAGVFVEMDGDLSHRPEELGDGMRLIDGGEYDVAIASKYVDGSAVVNRPVGRRCISRVCNFLVRRLMDPSIRDYSNGYRFYSRHAAELVVQKTVRYGSPIYLTEALGIWIATGLRIAEFHTTYVGRGKGESKLRLIDLVKAGIAVFEIAFRLHVVGFANRLPTLSESTPDRVIARESDPAENG